MGVVVVGQIPNLREESDGETHGVLQHTQAQPSRNQHLKVHNLLVGSEGSEGQWDEIQARGIVPSLTHHQQTVPQCSKVGCPTLASP